MKILIGAALLAAVCSASGAPPVESWSIATATRPSDGWIVIYRFADRLSPSLDKTRQPERVTVTWRYSGNKGMPLPSEQRLMDVFENAVETAPLQYTTLAIVSTGNHKRTWVYYTQSARTFTETVHRVLPDGTGASLEFDSASDPEWSAHSSMVRSIQR